MAPTPRKSGAQAYPAELAFQPQLKNCLVNLPSALVSVLVSANIVAQNVVIELTYRHNPPQTVEDTAPPRPIQKSIYVGWTGLQSRRKLASVVGSPRAGSSGREQEIPLVEIDSTFAKLLGLSDGQKASVLLHVDPPQAHTVNIEPLTAADWEIIELHANFLELNFLSQIRALPNPATTSTQGPSGHPLTLHLSPTSTANILVKSITPAQPAASAFAKISPDAEVIVAPKTRQRPQKDGTSSVQSVGGRSGGTSTKNKSSRGEPSSRKPIFLRGVDREEAGDWFDDTEESERNEGLKIWVDWSVLTSKNLKGITWVWVSIVRPAGLQSSDSQQPQGQQSSTENQENNKVAARVIAQIAPWEDSPDTRHVAVSTPLSHILDAKGAIGETIRIEAAPAQLGKSVVKTMRVYPFAPPADRQRDGFRFGGKSKADREEAARRIQSMYGKNIGGNRVLEGPLTDGMLLPPPSGADATWDGGFIKFDPVPGPYLDPAKTTRGWLLGSERRFNIEVMAEVPQPTPAAQNWSVGEPLPSVCPTMVGIDSLISELNSHFKHNSSVLLTGGIGAGKTCLAQLLAYNLRKRFLFHTTYFSCQSLVTDETRISAIKEKLNQIFGLAAWGSRLGGHALIILDDVDKLCPVETELQVGGDNGRSRHISEVLISTVKEYCTIDSRVVLLATAQNKDSVNNVLIGGHIVREIVNLPAPDKESRRRVLEMLVHKDTKTDQNQNGIHSKLSDSPNNQGWMDGTSSSESASDSENDQSKGSSHQRNESRDQSNGFEVDPAIDFLDIAGQTDGYMPGDLALLVSRTRSEALIRNISSDYQSSLLELTAEDFTAALKGFTPSSLRNVTLQHSSTTFSSIGGLKDTRQILLETLQYPTLYAPIFEKCPLRLRSGLLLYGFPGCGKTLLASAVAGECGLNFISVKGPEILNKYIGASEKSVRDLFERAQSARPCVLFFDEFDSIAPKRGHDSTGVTDRVVNQLLTQMDGAEGLSGVYVLAATSRPDMIDPALLRPGRLDKSLLCDMPKLEDRLDILRALSKKLRMDPLVSDDSGHNTSGEKTLREVARRTEGYSGADLQAVVYNAQLEAIHDTLNDRPGTGSGVKPKQSSASLAKMPSTTHTPDFTYFRAGDKDSSSEAPVSAAQKASERATIAAQLAAHKTAQQRARAERHRSAASSTQQGQSHDSTQEKDGPNSEPLIEWTHVERALSQTRASISQEERVRLASIYREFVVGRNGEMPNGQGGSEIGGRTSLM